MTAALAPAELRRLVGALALLGSDKPGEVVAAATAAHRIISTRGLTWDALLTPAIGGVHSAHHSDADDWRDDLDVCVRHHDRLTLWERRFVADMQHRWRASPKQIACTAKIAGSLRARGCA